MSEIFNLLKKITSFENNNKGLHIYFFSKDSVLDGKKAIRGGIPVVFRKYDTSTVFKPHMVFALWRVLYGKKDRDDCR